VKYVRRQLEPLLLEACRNFPACVLTGPRRSGKTWLLKHLFPKASYVLLEDPDIIARVRADPRGFLEELAPPVVLDEIQHVPELVPYVRTLIDRAPEQFGNWLLTGSQEAPLMQGMTESLAGRAAVFQLLPFSVQEHRKWNLLRGGFPEVLARPKVASLWFSSYLQTYLERDVRSLTAVRDLSTFRRFLALLAARHGQILNKSDLAAPLGVSIPTVTQWLHILETTLQIILVPPFYENFSKRVVKSPKLYWTDSGLAAHLLGIDSQPLLEKSPFLGPIFEGFVASEILKRQLNAGKRRELYYYRDHAGLEVDFIVPGAGRSLTLIEVKASKTVGPGMAAPLQRLAAAISNRATRSVIVHRRAATAPAYSTVARGVKTRTIEELVEEL
jgi:predicted AAA+ superfamily ATPase